MEEWYTANAEFAINFPHDLISNLNSNLTIIENSSSNSTRLLTRKEAAHLLSITLPTLHHWSKIGLIQAYYLGRRIYYKEDELMNALQKRWDKKGSLPSSFLDNPA